MDNDNFPPGKTPRVIIVAIQGVRQGVGGIFPPENGVFVCEQITNNLWRFEDPTPGPDSAYPCTQRICQYATTSSGTSCYMVFYHYYGYCFAFSGSMLTFSAAQPCVLHGDNQYPTSADPYYSGNFQAAWRSTADTEGSFAQKSVLIGMEASSKDLYEPITATDSDELYRLARKRDHSCIYARKEAT